MAKIFNRQKQKKVRRLLRKRSTDAERILWEQLRDKGLGVKFRRQFSIGNYIVDLYAPQLKLVIEIDGSIHEMANAKVNDDDRQRNLAALGLTVLRFTNDEITGNLESVIQQVKTIINNPLLTKERVAKPGEVI